jgi:hypothetical protein
MSTQVESSMSVLPTPVFAHSWFARAREMAADLLIATAVFWALPLLLGGAVALVSLLLAAL